MADKIPRCQIVPLAGHQVSLQIDGGERLRWHFGDAYPRPYFFPLVGPVGQSLTRMGHPGAPNHDHHQSIWFAHDKVLGISLGVTGVPRFNTRAFAECSLGASSYLGAFG